MNTSLASKLQISRLRGIEAARLAVSKVNLDGMRLFARSIAHEVVDHMEIPELSDRSCHALADVWAAAARGGDRDEAVSAVISWIEARAGITPASGLDRLGFEGWGDLVRAGLGLGEEDHPEGVDVLAELVASEAEALMGSRALEAIPSHAVVEMSYVPGWDGESPDEAVEQLGLSFTGPWCSVGTLNCGPQLDNLLRFANVSLPDFLAAVKLNRASEYEQFASRVQSYLRHASPPAADRSRAQLMSAEDLITVVENSCRSAIPNVSFQVRLKALIGCDPARDLVLESPTKAFHIGCHDGFVSGAGFMDAVKPTGPVVLDLQSGALISEQRWSYSLARVYGHVKSAFRVTLHQESEDQVDVLRMMSRMNG